MKNGIILGDDGKGNLLLSNEDGLFESHDNGETWEQWTAEKIDFAPVIHARWESNYVANKKVYEKINGDLVCIEDGTIDLIMCCSNCNHRAFVNNGIYVKTPYCSYCGAKMDKE